MKAQENTGVLKGKITDKESKEPLVGATVLIVGTYNSAPTDLNGEFIIKNVKHGDYSIKISYIGYADKLLTGIKIKSGEETTLSTDMIEAANTLGEVVVEGDKSIIDLETGNTKLKIIAEDIKEMNVRNVQDIVALQPSVNQTTDGIQVRGGRVYETMYLIDGVNASDPLAGNGSGVSLSSNSIQDLTLITGGAGAEFGGASSGVISTKIKEGSSVLKGGASWQTDNFRVWKNQGMGWNTDIMSAYLNGPIPGTSKKLTFYTGLDVNLTDEYTRIAAKQLNSSLVSNSKFWAPTQNNSWMHTLKLSYNIKSGMKISILNQHSLDINQNTRTLLIQGFTQVMQPGFQYAYSLNMDNATTYTKQTNLTVINFIHLFSKQWQYEVSLGRMFAQLRADANGRPFRPDSIDRVYDPASIVTDPVSIYEPSRNSPVVLVNPGPGLYNNNGISTLWHDHYAQRYSINWKFRHISKNGNSILTFGQNHEEYEYQWVDITSPWVGAPITLPDGSKTPSSSIGTSTDIWFVRPAQGQFFVSDEIKYKGITATLGLNFNYFAQGSYVDNIAKDTTNNVPLPKEIRQDYLNQSTDILGRRFQARLLPSVMVQFPVTNNNILFFNYGQAMRLYPHPQYVYQGLNPNYQSSFNDQVGNPALKPEITVTYEIGLKSQITKNSALAVTAFYKDVFDYQVTRQQNTIDRTGQAVVRSIYINADYARIRGLEVFYNQRINKAFRATASLTYQIVTGKFNNAAEARLQIQNQGYVGVNKENYLAWDTPIDSKINVIFTPDSSWRIGRFPLKNFRVFLTNLFRSNFSRYTPYYFTGQYTDYGRPIYLENTNANFSQLSTPIWQTDIKVSYDIKISKSSMLTFNIEMRNIFDIKNAQIIDPVTGTAYQYGDPLPSDTRDPAYNYPQASGLPPYNPARYKQPRQLLMGVGFRF